jgi:hypothetical protein
MSGKIIHNWLEDLLRYHLNNYAEYYFELTDFVGNDWSTHKILESNAEYHKSW